MKKEWAKVKAYGDHMDDGRIQVTFTLPIPAGDQAKEAARFYMEKLNLERVDVCWMESMGEEFTYFVAYGHTKHSVDYTKIKISKPAFPHLSFDELVKLAHEKIKRRIVVIGATTGSDAHTVGLDAILSIKGYAGEKGLEVYPMFQVVNLRAQVDNKHLINKAVELKADAILVSKMVTQQDQHIKDLKELAQGLRQEKGLSSSLVKIVGGPRIDHRLAQSLGFEAGFGPGSKPSEVANFIVHEMVRRLHGETPYRMEGNAPSSSGSQRRSLFGWLSGRGKNS